MARLLVAYDPTGRLDPAPETVRELRLRQAMLDLPDNLDSTDIYALARKLAEMLLEQLA